MAAPAGAADSPEPPLVPDSLLYRLAAAAVLACLAFLLLRCTRFWRTPTLRAQDAIGPLHPLAWFAGALALYLFAQALGGWAALAAGGAPAPSGTPPEFRVLSITSGVFYFVAVLLSIGAIVVFRRLSRASPQPTLPWSGLLAGLIGFLLTVPVLVLVGDLSALVHIWLVGSRPDPIAHGTLEVLLDHRADPRVFLLIFGAVVGAPVFEETVYRGLLQTSLVRALRMRGLGVALTACLFTLAHLGVGAGVPWQALPQIFTVGLVCGLLREHPRGGLSGAMAFHALFNASNVVLALYLVPTGAGG